MAQNSTAGLHLGKPLWQRFGVAFAGAVVMWLLLAYTPALRQVERGFSRVISWVLFPGHDSHEGEGTASDPFVMEKWQAPARVIAPFVIGIKESEQTTFDVYPLSASDYAVLLQELHLNAVPRVMLGGNLAWTDADPFAIDALEQISGKFETCITSAAVMRAATDGPVPAAFLRASVPVAGVQGDVLSLPRVSQLAVPQTFLGQEKTWAGFSRIETLEVNPTTTYIVARWGDRLIFSSTFLALLAQEGVTPEELQIRVGHSILFPRSGKRIALDAYGRAMLDPVTLPAVDLRAELLIRPEPKTLALINQQHRIVHLLDQAEGASSEEQQRSLWTFAQAPTQLEHVVLARLPRWAELFLCAAFCLQLIVIGTMQRGARVFAWVLLAALWLLAIRFGHTWLPVSPMLAATIIMVLGSRGASRAPNGQKVGEPLVIEFLPPREVPQVAEKAADIAVPEEAPPSKPTPRARKKAKVPDETPPLIPLEPLEEVPKPSAAQKVAKQPAKQPAKKAAKKAARKGKKS